MQNYDMQNLQIIARIGTQANALIIVGAMT